MDQDDGGPTLQILIGDKEFPPADHRGQYKVPSDQALRPLFLALEELSRTQGNGLQANAPFCPTASVVLAVIGVPVGYADREAARNSSAPSTATQHMRPTMCLMITLLSISVIFHERPRSKGMPSHLWQPKGPLRRGG
jgi:hypothetical protein